MAQAHRLAQVITCHAWNKDMSMLALCPNSNEVLIFKKKGNEFVKAGKLSEHDQIVTGLDWAHDTNKIVSCSQDRNAYVFTFEENRWKPTLVILRINRAATVAKFSPKENKFAVGSGAKILSICFFDEENNWWVAKHIRKFKSSVVSVDWHPDNVLLAAGSTDFKCRIFSAFIKGPDKRGNETLFGKDPKFGECLMEFDLQNSWVHSVSWAPSGNYLVYATHDSALCFVNDPTSEEAVERINTKNLPFRSVLFLSETDVVAAGYDYCPYVFHFNGEAWENLGSADKKVEPKKTATKTQTAMAFDKFRSQTSRGTAQVKTAVSTTHQNTISEIQPLADGSGFSCSGVDGRLTIWKNDFLKSVFSQMEI